MNTIILSFSLILIIFSFTFIILNNKKEKLDEEFDKIDKGEIEDEYEDEFIDSKSSNYVDYLNNSESSHSIESKEGANFSKVLDSTKEKMEKQHLSDETPQINSLSDFSNNLTFNQKSKNIIDYKVDIKEKSQDYVINKIIELSNAGLKAEEIAKITEKGVREVEIILKLQNIKNIK